ncbi:hypothetical protein FQN52_005516 [Onygenales sp. PD_12]|nr:hypothetical protein FQN52_005516 [Onygenales sp. PD_12]
MSKAFAASKDKFKSIKNAASKFKATAIEGHRLVPSRAHDHSNPFRIDAGRYSSITGRLKVILQINKNPDSKGLEAWIRKFTTHGKLATAYFHVDAEDQQAEYERVVEELFAKGRNNLKDMKEDDDSVD